MNKTGAVESSDTMLIFLGGAFVLTAVFLSYTAITGLIETQKTQNYQDIEAWFDDVRLFNAKHCFALETNGRTYPGIVDAEKVTNDQINECYTKNAGDPPAVKALLYADGDFEKNATTSSWTTTTTTTVDRDRYPVSVNKETIGVLEVYHK